jgi:hypothetical protein
MMLRWKRLAVALALFLLLAGTLLAQFRAVPSGPSGGFGRGIGGGGFGAGRGGGGFGGWGSGGGTSKPAKPTSPFDPVVKDLPPLLQKCDWRQANQLIAEKIDRYPQAQQALRELLRETKQVARLERLRAALTAPPGDALLAWQRVPLRKLPESLRPSARLLAALATLQAEARRIGPPGDPEDLQEALADFRQLAREPSLVHDICFDLAAHAFLAGNGTESRQLLRQSGSSNSLVTAALLLSDLKTLVLGEGGSIHTDAARTSLALRPATGGATVRGPPQGITDLLPPEALSAWREPGPAPLSGPSLLDRSLSAYFNGHGTLARKLLASTAYVPPALVESRLRDLKVQMTGDEDQGANEPPPPGGGWPLATMPFAEVRGGDVRAGIDENPLRFLDQHDATSIASFQAAAHRQQLKRLAKKELAAARQRLQQAHQKAVQAISGGGGPGGDLPLPSVVIIVDNDDKKHKLRRRIEQLLGNGINDRAWRLACQLRRAGESDEDIVAELGPMGSRR